MQESLSRRGRRRGSLLCSREPYEYSYVGDLALLVAPAREAPRPRIMRTGDYGSLRALSGTSAFSHSVPRMILSHCGAGPKIKSSSAPSLDVALRV